MKLLCTGLMVMLALVSLAQPGNKQQRAMNNAVRDLQQWQRKQLPTNSVLYKMNYQTMYPDEALRYEKNIPYPAGLNIPFQNASAFNPFSLSHVQVPEQTAANSYRVFAENMAVKPEIPLHHALMMRRTFLPPPGYGWYKTLASSDE